MTKHSIPARFVGKVDQDLTTARANLEQHLEDFARFHAQGDAPETVFAGFAAAMLRETNPYHLAIMFSAAVLTLFEREQQTEKDRSSEFKLLVRTIGTTQVFDQVHLKCRRGFVIPVDSEPTQAHFRLVAEDHLRGCEA